MSKFNPSNTATEALLAENVPPKVFDWLTRPKLFSLAMFILITTLMGLYLSNSDTWVFTVVGGVLGSSSALVVCITYLLYPVCRQHPSPLLFFRCLVNLCMGLRFALQPTWMMTFCNSPSCHIPFNNSNCRYASSFLELFEMSSEIWFFCVSLDLYYSLTNPFYSFKRNMKLYHCLSWSIGVLAFLVMFFNSDSYGAWYVKSEYDDSVFCWFKSSHNSSLFHIEVWTWLLFYLPVGVIYVFAIGCMYKCYRRLKAGLSKTFKQRIRVIIFNMINLTVFGSYWILLMILYMMTYILAAGNDRHGMVEVNRIVFFGLASKGFIDLIVWILITDYRLVIDSSSSSSSGTTQTSIESTGVRSFIKMHMLHSLKRLDPDYKYKPHLNLALIQELLFYVTSGIRRCATHVVRRSATGMSIAGSLATSADEHDDDDGETVTILIKPPESSKCIQMSGFLKLMFSRANDAAYTIFNATKDSNASVVDEEASVRHSSDQLSFATVNEACNPATKTLDGGDDEWLGSVKCATIDESSRSSSLVFVDYRPSLFKKLRISCRVSDTDFSESFARTAKERLTEGGASGAFFFYSGDERYIAKSCTRRELTTLLRISEAYVDYLVNNPDSFITRILGCYKLRLYGHEIFFLVMTNLFYAPPSTSTSNTIMNSARYDLKGSWVNRDTKIPKDGDSVTCKLCNKKYVFLNSNARGLSEIVNGVCTESGNGQHIPNRVFKDNDLTFKIRLLPSESELVSIQLSQDADALSSWGVMDYSLLVGVNYSEYDVNDASLDSSSSSSVNSSPGKTDFYRRRISLTPSSDSITPTSSSSSKMSESGFAVGERKFKTHRLVGPSNYHIGIIDFLQEYDFSKKMEFFIKTKILGHEEDGVSCIPVEPYVERFKIMIKEVIST